MQSKFAAIRTNIFYYQFLKKVKRGEIELNEKRDKMGSLTLKSTADVFRNATSIDYDKVFGDSKILIDKYLETGDETFLWFFYFKEIGFKRTLKHYAYRKKLITPNFYKWERKGDLFDLKFCFQSGLEMYKKWKKK